MRRILAVAVILAVAALPIGVALSSSLAYPTVNFTVTSATQTTISGKPYLVVVVHNNSPYSVSSEYVRVVLWVTVGTQTMLFSPATTFSASANSYATVKVSLASDIGGYYTGYVYVDTALVNGGLSPPFFVSGYLPWT